MSRIDKNTFLQHLVNRVKTGKTLNNHSTQKSMTAEHPAHNLAFEQRITAALAAIDPTSDNATKKALEVYINAALLEAFPQLINDPAYAHLLSDVLEAIEQSDDYPDFSRFVESELKHVHN